MGDAALATHDVVGAFFLAHEAQPVEMGDLGRHQRPWRPVCVAPFFAGAGDEQKAASRRHQRGDSGEGIAPQIAVEGLERVALVDEIEGAKPVGRWREKVGDAVVDIGSGKTLARPADGFRGEIESDRPVSGGGDGLCVVTEAAGDIDRRPAFARMGGEPFGQGRLRFEIGPGNRAVAAMSLAIDRLEIGAPRLRAALGVRQSCQPRPFRRRGERDADIWLLDGEARLQPSARRVDQQSTSSRNDNHTMGAMRRSPAEPSHQGRRSSLIELSAEDLAPGQQRGMQPHRAPAAGRVST